MNRLQNQKSTENFRELATGTATCKICKKEGIKRLERHLSESHNITSLEEYEEVAMYVPKSASPEKPTPQPLLNLTASSTMLNQMGVNAMIPTQQVLGAGGHWPGVDRVTSLQSTPDLPEEIHSKTVVQGLPMWKCELCQNVSDSPISDHVSQQHGMSLGEYIHLVKEESVKMTQTSRVSKIHIVTNKPEDNSTCGICRKGLFINEKYKETHMRTMHGVETNKTANDTIAHKKSSLVERIDEDRNMDSLDNLDVKMEDFSGDPLATMESFVHINYDNELPVLFLPDD